MTFEQIFYRFCKKENIYSEVSERLKQSCIKREQLLQVGPKGYITPRELLFSLIDRYGLEKIFQSLFELQYYSSEFYRRYPKFKSIVRRWVYFCRNNIFINEDTLKNGDEITVSCFGSNLRMEANIIDGLRVQSYRGSWTFSILKINQVNGKKANIDFYVKKNNQIFN